MNTIVSAQGFEYGVKHFLTPYKGRAIDIIQSVLNLSDSEFLDLFQIGAIYIQQQRLREFSTVFSEGTSVRIHTKPRRYFCDYDWEQLIVFQSDDFLILNKPAGLPSHPSVDNQIENSLTQTEYALNQKLHISHRLDTTTEGLIVYGKTKEFVKNFNQQIQNHQIKKNYVALCETEKILPEKLIHYMEQSPRAPKKVSEIFSENSDFCELDILQQKKIDADRSWIKINLLTGRTHQIRAQLAHQKAPLCGDILYGAQTVWTKNEKSTHQIALRSQMIEFSWAEKTHQFVLDESFEVTAAINKL